VKRPPGAATDAETDIVVDVVAPVDVVVAVSGTAVIRVVVPGTAPQSGSPDPSSIPRPYEGTEYLFLQLPSIAVV
jgi:hypothetical protein